MLVIQRGRQTLRRQLYHPVSGSVSSRPEDYQRLWANDGIRIRVVTLRRQYDGILAEETKRLEENQPSRKAEPVTNGTPEPTPFVELREFAVGKIIPGTRKFHDEANKGGNAPLFLLFFMAHGGSYTVAPSLN